MALLISPAESPESESIDWQHKPGNPSLDNPDLVTGQ
jgi:hypothetical protein